MRYHIIHRTTYTYDSPVTVSHYLARLLPRPLANQECPWHELLIRPEPIERSLRTDYFGNHSVYFEVEGAHQQLEVIARSLVDIRPPPAFDPAQTPAWETIRDRFITDVLGMDYSPAEFRFASALIQTAPIFADYAMPSFPPGRPIAEAVISLNHRIHTEFVFDPTATDLATPITKVMEQRRGVCQDFAQVMIACLRSIGLPARYVSGYLETRPPPGKPRLVGADASHAWVAAWCGDKLGWLDADPTNDVLPTERHITAAWGRDFSDVSPLRGVTLGAGEQRLQVAVDVLPSDDG